MVKRIIRVYVEKSSVDQQTLPDLVGNVRTMLQENLVKFISLSANEYSRIFLKKSKLLSRRLELDEVADLFSAITGFPEVKEEWQSLSTSISEDMGVSMAEAVAELALKYEKFGTDALSGWNYSVRDEVNCVTGKLEFFTRGLTLEMDTNTQVKVKEVVPGFKISDEIINDY